jgi:hypothetical protein
MRMSKRLIAPAAAVILLLAACGETASGDGGGGDGGGGGMTLEFVSPAEGAEIGIPFDVQFDSSEELGPTEDGVHHVHVYFDGDDSTYEVVEGESWEVTTIQAPAGEHTLHASLRNADHSAAGVETQIDVTVGQGGTDGGSDGGGIDY